jgi:hypothetical protein
MNEQPLPNPSNEGPSTQELVRQDLVTREQVGIARYGTGLRPFNGRNNIRDAYEEALDLACYLRNEMEQRHLTRRLTATELLERMESAAQELENEQALAFVRAFLLPYRYPVGQPKEDQPHVT